MAEPKTWGPFKPVLGVLYSDQRLYFAAIEACKAMLGEVEKTLGPVKFHWTDYYNREMGGSIQRVWLSFACLLEPRLLADLKLETNSIENQLRCNGRKVNLDPGLLSPWNFVLATAKARGQRVYLKNGIFGDLTLIFRRGRYEPLPWTYPDYGWDKVRLFLRDVRQLALAQWKNSHPVVTQLQDWQDALQHALRTKTISGHAKTGTGHVAP